MDFRLEAPYSPNGDQPTAIETLVEGVEGGQRYQTLLGATGTGKTFSIANVIQRTGRPALVLAHNKTLAAAHVISRAVSVPVLCASGLSAVTLPLAQAAGAAGVGVGSAINRLSDELAMVAVVRGLRDALSALNSVQV